MTLPGDFVTEAALRSNGAPWVHLRILATSDLHAHLLPFDYYTNRRAHGVGLARLGSMIERARRSARNSLLFDNGDTYQGAPLADAAAARALDADLPHPMIAAMNGLGYDAATLGNHDFDFGLEFLASVVGQAGFPVVLANAHRSDGTPFLSTRILLRRRLRDSDGALHPLCIGVTGAVPPQVAMWNKAHVAGALVFGDIISHVGAEVAALKAEGADLVIVLAHSGVGHVAPGPGAENVAAALTALPDVDAVIAGHTHKTIPDGMPVRNAKVPLVQAASLGTHLGCIDLALRRSEPGGNWTVIGNRSEAVLANTRRPDDPPRLRRILPERADLRPGFARAHRATRAFVDRPLGQTAIPLETYFSAVAPCAATQIVADAQRAAARALLEAHRDLRDLPLVSAVAPFRSGGQGGPWHYTDVPAGPLKLRHAADLYIYPNLMSLVRIKGLHLRDWLERSVSLYRTIKAGADGPQSLIDHAFAPYNFDRLDGLRYDIDLGQPARTNAEGDVTFATPGRIRNLRHVDGRSVEDDEDVVVSTNTYRAAGGGHFAAPLAADAVITGPDTVRDALARYISGFNGAVEVRPSPTWSFLPMGGTEVVLVTGPGARGHPDRITELGLTPTDLPEALPEQGFVAYALQI